MPTISVRRLDRSCGGYGVSVATKLMRINVGAGEFPLRDWVNVDADPAAPVQVHATVPPLPFPDGSASEISACHFLEHLSFEDADAFLQECHRVLVPNGLLAVVVPDTREVMRAYVEQTGRLFEFPLGHRRTANDLDDISAVFLYSTVQDTPHLWSYDLDTLARKLGSNGFRPIREMDRFNDRRIAVGAWYQCGLLAVRV